MQLLHILLTSTSCRTAPSMSSPHISGKCCVCCVCSQAVYVGKTLALIQLLVPGSSSLERELCAQQCRGQGVGHKSSIRAHQHPLPIY